MTAEEIVDDMKGVLQFAIGLHRPGAAFGSSLHGRNIFARATHLLELLEYQEYEFFSDVIPSWGACLYSKAPR